METLKVVAQYIDGRVVKGLSQDFFPNKDHFHVYPADKASSETIEIFLKELKAVFFVRDFVGDFQYNERKEYVEGDKPSG